MNHLNCSKDAHIFCVQVKFEAPFMIFCKNSIHYRILYLFTTSSIDRFYPLILEVLIVYIRLLVLICMHSQLVMLWESIVEDVVDSLVR